MRSGDRSAPDPALLCRACRHPITRRSAAIAVAGTYDRVVFNPAGVLFRIGCFREAPGAHDVGPRTARFSWFAGHGWRIAVCGGCGHHLGWGFAAIHGQTAPAAFHGLILDALTEGDAGR